MKQADQLSHLERAIGNKYQVLRRIGGGGMAEVFLAQHRVHHGFVAIKVLAEYLSRDPNTVARFTQEARTAATLSGHPNIVPIIDIAQDDGLNYLIMQYVPGEDLGSYLRREGKLRPAYAANIIAQIAEGLRWSASKSVVHRDLKPGNVLLDVSGRAILVDFGISRIVDISAGLTRPGESLGTPHYMSPEQIRGESCDVRSDLYSLGVVFFELLTGFHPFENQSVTAIQMAHLSSPPPSLLRLNSELPAVYDKIVQRLLQKRPQDRYQTPEALLDELHALGASSGVSALRPHIDPEILADLTRNSPASIVEMDTAPPPDLRIPLTAETQLAMQSPGEDIEIAPQKLRSRTWLVAAVSIASSLIAVALVFLLLTARNRPKPVISDNYGTMILVPAGKFIFGGTTPESPNPQQELDLPAFYIDETEVSNKQYRAFCDATGHPFPTQENATDPDDPVAGVTIGDANAYAAWSHKRLPSEQEWEKAARGTDGRLYPWGNTPWTADIPNQLQPVISFPERKSPYGALNMAGNVYEWTAARFPAGAREFADMEANLKTSSFSRSWYVIKGGSFSPHGDVFFASYLRRGFPSDQHSPVIGFRCVRDVSKGNILAR